MNNVVRTVGKIFEKQETAEFGVGDTLKVYVRIKEGNKERLQVFEGYVLKKQGGGIGESFTVRRIASGVGVERTFLINSPKIEKVELLRKGKIRRARLFYMRDRTGKATKIKHIEENKKAS
jgi:large subunit ribosomal protein L19